MTDPQDGYFNLKHRLVGATALILAAVILLPRVLTGTQLEPVRSSVDTRTALQIQPQVSAIVSPADSKSVEVSTRTRIEIIEPSGVAKTDGETGSVESSEAHSHEGINTQNTKIPSSLGLPVYKSIVTGFIAQVGIFQRPENAINLISDLKMD